MNNIIFTILGAGALGLSKKTKSTGSASFKDYLNRIGVKNGEIKIRVKVTYYNDFADELQEALEDELIVELPYWIERATACYREIMDWDFDEDDDPDEVKRMVFDNLGEELDIYLHNDGTDDFFGHYSILIYSLQTAEYAFPSKVEVVESDRFSEGINSFTVDFTYDVVKNPKLLRFDVADFETIINNMLKFAFYTYHDRCYRDHRIYTELYHWGGGPEQMEIIETNPSELPVNAKAVSQLRRF